MADHLTQPNKELARQQAATAKGQAHWALTGPPGKICRECVFWGLRGSRPDYYANGSGLKPRPCQKYKDLMSGKAGPAVPEFTPSCRHFKENPKPPESHRASW